jgi:hypothetical protein
MKILVQIMTVSLLAGLGFIVGLFWISWIIREVECWRHLTSFVRMARAGLSLILSGLLLSFLNRIFWKSGLHGPLGLLAILNGALLIGFGQGMIRWGLKSTILAKTFNIHSAKGSFVLPVIVCSVMILNAAALIYHIEERELVFITQLRPSILIIIGLIEALLISATFFWLRSVALHFYGCLEITIGVMGIFVIFKRMPIDKPDVAYILACLSSIYIIVRGLDNLSKWRTSVRPTLKPGPSSQS